MNALSSYAVKLRVSASVTNSSDSIGRWSSSIERAGFQIHSWSLFRTPFFPYSQSPFIRKVPMNRSLEYGTNHSHCSCQATTARGTAEGYPDRGHRECRARDTGSCACGHAFSGLSCFVWARVRHRGEGYCAWPTGHYRDRKVEPRHRNASASTVSLLVGIKKSGGGLRCLCLKNRSKN
jgi:hypothetical protein